MQEIIEEYGSTMVVIIMFVIFVSILGSILTTIWLGGVPV